MKELSIDDYQKLTPQEKIYHAGNRIIDLLHDELDEVTIMAFVDVVQEFNLRHRLVETQTDIEENTFFWIPFRMRRNARIVEFESALHADRIRGRLNIHGYNDKYRHISHLADNLYSTNLKALNPGNRKALNELQAIKKTSGLLTQFQDNYLFREKLPDENSTNFDSESE